MKSTTENQELQQQLKDLEVEIATLNESLMAANRDKEISLENLSQEVEALKNNITDLEQEKVNLLHISENV